MNATTLAVSLSLLSALTLAGANMSVKLGSDILVGRAALSLNAAALVLPAAFIVPVPDGPTWWALAATLPAHFCYQMFLVRALQGADLSLVFPVMRGAAPLLTACVAMVVLGEHLSWVAWLGLLTATIALVGFVAPPPGMRLRAHPDAAALGWAAATAIGVAFYNTLDARGMRIAPDPFTFIVWLFMLDPIGITAVLLLTRRHPLRVLSRLPWRHGAAAGGLSVVSFGSALYAFSLMEAARVAALRETSVVIAAYMGSRFLREGFARRRIVAAAVLAAGLVLMQFGD